MRESTKPFATKAGHRSCAGGVGMYPSGVPARSLGSSLAGCPASCVACATARPSASCPRRSVDEKPLTSAIIRLAQQYGRYGYRRITVLLRNEGWLVNAKRVERIWRREGLKVPQKQPKRGRLWFNDGSCVRLRPQYPGHVWSYDFGYGPHA